MTIRKSTRPIPKSLLPLSPGVQEVLRRFDQSDGEQPPKLTDCNVTIRDLVTVFWNSRAIALEDRKLRLKNEKDREEFQILRAVEEWHSCAIRERFVLALLERMFRIGGSSRLYSHSIIENFLVQADTSVVLRQIAVTQISSEEYSNSFEKYLGFAT
jgi:hypothetical protein